MKRFLFFLIISSITVKGQINSNATALTKKFYKNLLHPKHKTVLLGHQDALAYGLNADGSRWVGEENRSDIHSIAGEYPGVVGYDLGRLELDSIRNLDQVPFEAMRKNMVKTFERGGINTISWHPNNPLDPSKTSWDKVEKTIPQILQNPEHLKTYKDWLDKLAHFMLSVKTQDGKLVPLIFRPFHEHTGSWFWWGADHCTPKEYIQFWKFTVDYLLNTRKVNNILICYSTDVFRDKPHYLERYPGNNYVDMIGFDAYQRSDSESFKKQMERMLKDLKQMAEENMKPYAITEMGLEKITDTHWWTKLIEPVMKDSGLTYFLLWRNGYDKHYYAPYPGHASVNNFKEMLKSGSVGLEKSARKLQWYN